MNKFCGNYRKSYSFERAAKQKYNSSFQNKGRHTKMVLFMGKKCFDDVVIVVICVGYELGWMSN